MYLFLCLSPNFCYKLIHIAEIRGFGPEVKNVFECFKIHIPFLAHRLYRTEKRTSLNWWVVAREVLTHPI